MPQTVLVLEESQIVQNLIAQTLKRHDLETHQELNPQKFSDALAVGDQVLVLIDLKHYSKIQTLLSSSMPAVALLDAKSQVDKQTLLDMGFKGWLRRPFEAKDLMSQIRLALPDLHAHSSETLYEEACETQDVAGDEKSLIHNLFYDHSETSQKEFETLNLEEVPDFEDDTLCLDSEALEDEPQLDFRVPESNEVSEGLELDETFSDNFGTDEGQDIFNEEEEGLELDETFSDNFGTDESQDAFSEKEEGLELDETFSDNFGTDESQDAFSEKEEGLELDEMLSGNFGAGDEEDLPQFDASSSETSQFENDIQSSVIDDSNSDLNTDTDTEGDLSDLFAEKEHGMPDAIRKHREMSFAGSSLFQAHIPEKQKLNHGLTDIKLGLNDFESEISIDDYDPEQVQYLRRSVMDIVLNANDFDPEVPDIPEEQSESSILEMDSMLLELDEDEKYANRESQKESLEQQVADFDDFASPPEPMEVGVFAEAEPFGSLSDEVEINMQPQAMANFSQEDDIKHLEKQMLDMEQGSDVPTIDFEEDEEFDFGTSQLDISVSEEKSDEEVNFDGINPAETESLSMSADELTDDFFEGSQQLEPESEDVTDPSFGVDFEMPSSFDEQPEDSDEVSGTDVNFGQGSDAFATMNSFDEQPEADDDELSVGLHQEESPRLELESQDFQNPEANQFIFQPNTKGSLETALQSMISNSVQQALKDMTPQLVEQIANQLNSQKD